MVTIHIPLAKITPPRIAAPMLLRGRLHDAVRAGIARKLLVLSAEAGYGKTSLLVGTLPDGDPPAAWLTLDPDESDPNLLGASLAAAVSRVVPESEVWVERILTLGPDSVNLRRLLVQMLDDLPPLVIALDDFHSIEGSPPAVDLIDHLLTNLPSTAHVVIATRTWPSLRTLPRFLVQAEATVLDRTQLQFSETEASIFLRETHALAIDDAHASELARRTEGWPAALHLAAMASKTHGRPTLSGTPREVFDYLAATVIESLDEVTRDFLLRTSILTELWPTLCRAVAPQIPAVEMLRDLERRNMFLWRLDDAGPRYRYHQLFREFLHDRLGRSGSETVVNLHHDAAQRLEAEGIPDQAVRHYVAAGEYAEAERVMKPLHGDRLTAKLAYTFRELVTSLPDEIQNRHPWMTRCGASAARFVGDYALGLTLARRALAASEGRDTDLWAFSIHGVGVMLSHLDRPDEAAELCERALRSLDPRAAPQFRAGIITDLLIAYLRLGRIRDTAGLLLTLRQILYEGTQPGKSYGPAYYAGRLAATRMEYSRALEHFKECIRVGDERRSANLQLWGWLGMLRAEIGRGDLSGSREALMEARRLHALAGERDSELTLMHLAGDVHLLAAEWREAETAYRQTIASVRESESQEQRLWAQQGLARLARERAQFRTGEALLTDTAEAAERLKFGTILPHIRFEQVAIHHAAGRPDTAALLLPELRTTMQEWDAGPGLARCDLLEVLVHHDPAARKDLDAYCVERLRRVFRLDAEALSELMPFLKSAAVWTVPLFIDSIRNGIELGRAVDVLGAIGEEAVEPIISVLSDAALQGHAITLLETIGDPRARRPLLLLAKRNPALRGAAEQALKRLREPEPVMLMIRMLGAFEVDRGTERIPESAWKTQKVKMLLKFLVLNRSRRVSQDELIEVLWPEVDPAGAARNLKGAIKTLRQALEPLLEGTRSSFIQRRGDTVQFVVENRCRVDIDQYDQLLKAAHEYEAAGRPAEALATLERAAELYRGDLLEDDRYEDWAAAERERRREQQIILMEGIVDIHGRRGDYRRALEATQRVLALDRLREPAYRNLMRYALARGDRQAAIRAYQTCERFLREDLGVAPHPETVSLYDQARALTPA